MSAPKATEAAIAAVQQALGCAEFIGLCTAVLHNGARWTERGCRVAVAAADAAAPHIAAQTLRGLAAEVPTFSIHGYSVAEWLNKRADRIEAGQ